MDQGFIIIDERNTPDDEFVRSTTKSPQQSIDDVNCKRWLTGIPSGYVACLVSSLCGYYHYCIPCA